MSVSGVVCALLILNLYNAWTELCSDDKHELRQPYDANVLRGVDPEDPDISWNLSLALRWSTAKSQLDSMLVSLGLSILRLPVTGLSEFRLAFSSKLNIA